MTGELPTQTLTLKGAHVRRQVVFVSADRDQLKPDRYYIHTLMKLTNTKVSLQSAQQLSSCYMHTDGAMEVLSCS